MERTIDGLKNYLQVLGPLIGDLRTGRTVQGIIKGIMASGSLRMNQIALFSPSVQRESRGV